MMGTVKAVNNLDSEGNPMGGSVDGIGLKIDWQNGPLGRGEERKEPNGAFVETVIFSALQRIQHYQTTKFKCRENTLAMVSLEVALLWLNSRTQRRETEGTEGTHAENETTFDEIAQITGA